MAELMLVRLEDQRFLDAAGGGLRFLAFDELHTYRGCLGAEVATLVRRLKERAAAPSLIHISTSATMLSDRDAAPVQRHQDEALRAELEARGYQVIVIRRDREVSEQLRRWASLFGAV